MKLGKLLALSAASILMLTACGGKGGESTNSVGDTSESSENTSEGPTWNDEIVALFNEYIGVDVPYVEMGAEEWEWDEKYECVSVYGSAYSLELCEDYGDALEAAGWTVDVYDYFGDGTLTVEAAKPVGEQFAFVNFYGEEGFSELDAYLYDEDPFAVPATVELLNLVNEEVLNGYGEFYSLFGFPVLVADYNIDETHTVESYAAAFDTVTQAIDGIVSSEPMAWDDDYEEYYASYIYNDSLELDVSVYSYEDEDTGVEYCQVMFMAIEVEAE